MAMLFLMAIPASIADGGDVTIMQQTGEQPSHENNTFYLWGQSSGTPCWGHFNNTDDGSANEGYAESTQANGKMEVEWTCRMDPQLGHDFALEVDAQKACKVRSPASHLGEDQPSSFHPLIHL